MGWDRRGEVSEGEGEGGRRWVEWEEMGGEGGGGEVEPRRGVIRCVWQGLEASIARSLIAF